MKKIHLIDLILILAISMLTGDFETPAEGSLSGTQTTDGNRINGNYHLTTPNTGSGTWQATRK
ncbi:MAG: hypothetical protein P8185_07840 [Deltaproteobacteria bacterium]|jgi:hypothetical protein